MKIIFFVAAIFSTSAFCSYWENCSFKGTIKNIEGKAGFGGAFVEVELSEATEVESSHVDCTQYNNTRRILHLTGIAPLKKEALNIVLHYDDGITPQGVKFSESWSVGN